MSDYVRISSSIADILNLANNLRLRGESLTGAVDGALGEINQLDVPATFPPDGFTDGFLATYHGTVDVGEGRSMPANQAVRYGAGQVGPRLTEIGDFVTNAMWAYQQADEQGAVEIDGAGGDGTPSA